jgi:hypothetical protein
MKAPAGLALLIIAPIMHFCCCDWDSTSFPKEGQIIGFIYARDEFRTRNPAPTPDQWNIVEAGFLGIIVPIVIGIGGLFLITRPGPPVASLPNATRSPASNTENPRGWNMDLSDGIEVQWDCPSCGQQFTTGSDVSMRYNFCPYCRAPLIDPNAQAEAMRPVITPAPSTEVPVDNPKLMACPDCGRLVSKLAPACPQCGRPMMPASS